MLRSEIDLRYQYLWEEEDILDLPAITPGVSVNTEIIIPFRDLSLSAQAPNVKLFSGIRNPPSSNLTLSTTAPNVKVPKLIPSQNLALSSIAPTVSRSIVRLPPQGNLALSPTAPTVAQQTNRNISIPQGNLALSPTAPTRGVIPGFSDPPSRDLVLSPTAPTITVIFTSSARNPAAGNLVLSTLPPTVVTTTLGFSAPTITTLRPVAAT